MPEIDDRIHKERVALFAVCVLFLGLIPTVVAVILSDSVVMFAGLLKCFNEAIAVFISWRILRQIARGKGQEYDYGLGKLESMGSFLVTALLCVSIVIVCFGAFHRLFHPQPIKLGGSILGVVIQIGAVAMNCWFWWKNRKLAEKEYSPVMEAQWRLFRAKALSEGTILVTLLLSISFMNFTWSEYFDPIGSFVIVGFIAMSVRELGGRAVGDLLDRTLDESMQMVIVRKLAHFFDEYADLHGVRSRRSGARIYVEVFLEFDGDRPMADVQGTINRMTEALESEIPGSFVVISPTTIDLRQRLEQGSLRAAESREAGAPEPEAEGGAEAKSEG